MLNAVLSFPSFSISPSLHSYLCNFHCVFLSVFPYVFLYVFTALNLSLSISLCLSLLSSHIFSLYSTPSLHTLKSVSSCGVKHPSAYQTNRISTLSSTREQTLHHYPSIPLPITRISALFLSQKSTCQINVERSPCPLPQPRLHISPCFNS
jgi:hypothetical protein